MTYGTVQCQVESHGQTTRAVWNLYPRGLESLPARADACTGTHARHELSTTGNKY